MAVQTGGDGKLHYTNNNKSKFSDYWDWYDHGPGSESFKRELRESMKKTPPMPLNIEGFPWSTTKPEGAIPKSKEYITDSDLEIDI